MIDDDLGISASGTSARPRFESLVAQICEGVVGAVFCLKASRLARNGCDWHQLLELCGLVGARVFDVDGVYVPCHPNDGLLLGLKGTMSEFKLTVMRRRSLDAAIAMARRGELRSAYQSTSSGREKKRRGRSRLDVSLHGRNAAHAELARSGMGECPKHARITKRFTVHGLRYTFTDLVRRANVDAVVRRALTGHVTEEM